MHLDGRHSSVRVWDFAADDDDDDDDDAFTSFVVVSHCCFLETSKKQTLDFHYMYRYLDSIQHGIGFLGLRSR